MTTTLPNLTKRTKDTRPSGRTIETVFRLEDSGLPHRDDVQFIEFTLSVSHHKDSKRYIVTVSRQLAAGIWVTYELYSATADCPFEAYAEPAARYDRKTHGALHEEALAEVERMLPELVEWARQINRRD